MSPSARTGPIAPALQNKASGTWFLCPSEMESFNLPVLWDAIGECAKEVMLVALGHHMKRGRFDLWRIFAQLYERFDLGGQVPTDEQGSSHAPAGAMW